MVDKLKQTLAAIREAILVVVFLLLLVFPSCFNRILNDAGFTQGSVMGFTWKDQADSSQRLADSSEQIALVAAEQLERTKAALEVATHKLEASPSTAGAPEVKQMHLALDSANMVLNPTGSAPLKSVVLSQRVNLERLRANLKQK